ncbi:ABC transporter substrate-binding protein [Bradyrhizobium canariense]|uniref:Spermidine/putrescine transport system substrate-binding protein n=1 Tax=Bradyrhizobium canariense TaxID=255045 RepID=A0A1X3GQQ6_9BRAD|nr:ABC transporter substrate-binding protein [Bradyrhizobium canariense]OSI73167.1 hypothetical protein BSZ22_07950 [Bradyrhizobium canariense]OSI81269.1 hypothetical protein BSZ23_07255 [Bradyrhizobium canariense]OSI94544.1 hypothetical protein BSZ25_06555 [Bradyrhizobium canariense]OSI95132.1 hypothetical protein BSZ24_08330 [Bradyrhizobium canariense]OSJ08177.1 hypothetical protein BSZ16_07775 [Bradyrhizobium canariense]
MFEDGKAEPWGINRRRLMQSVATAMAVPAIARATTAYAQETLAGSGQVVVFGYGGSWSEAFRKFVLDPFTTATGNKVVEVLGDNAEPQIKAMNLAGRVDWDVAGITSMNYVAMDKAGMFAPIDYSLWDAESLKGVAEKDRRKNGVVMFSAGVVLSYDERAFPNGGPKNWIEFWDTKRFPGPRGLTGVLGKQCIVFALLADGVAPVDIWPLSDDKIDRAFKKLDEIRPSISKWWIAGGEAPQLLINRELVMSSAPDGRMISAIRKGAPLRMVWSGAYNAPVLMTILEGGPNRANAQKFVAFLNRAQIAAGYTQGTGYPGPNSNQLEHLPADLVSMLGINPENISKCVVEDFDWIGQKRSDGKTNADHIQERWLKWKAG